MKRLIFTKTVSVLSAVLLLIAAMSVTAFAADGDPVQYAIHIESNSEVYTPESTSVSVAQGDTFTFRIPDDTPTSLTDEELGEYSVTFSNWRFTGEFEVVSGSVDDEGCSFDRAIELKPLSDMSAIACFIEDNAAFYMVDVDTNCEAFVPYIDQGEVIKGETQTFSVPDDLEGFICWEFTGEYETVQGSVDENGISYDRKVVLRPLSNMDVFARFEEESQEEDKPAAVVFAGSTPEATPDQPVVIQNIDNSETSPLTGDRLPLWIGITVTVCIAGIIAVRKIRG